MRDLDDLIKDIDALVDWQLSDSPAAQAQSQAIKDDCDEDMYADDVTEEDVREVEQYLLDHPLVSRQVNGYLLYVVKCECPDGRCRYR